MTLFGQHFSFCLSMQKITPPNSPNCSFHLALQGLGAGPSLVTSSSHSLLTFKFQRIIPSMHFFWSISSLFIQRPQVILGELFDMSSQRRNAMISAGIIPSCIHLELTSPHRHSSTSHKLLGGSCARNATLPSPFTF